MNPVTFARQKMHNLSYITRNYESIFDILADWYTILAVVSGIESRPAA